MFTHRRATRSRPIALAALAALPLAGCQLPNAQQAAQQDSILPVLFSATPTPEEANRMANDASNPDRRARGIVYLMNAPFGGEPVYIDLYERRIAPADPDTGLAEEHPAVRAAAARALSLHGDPKHVDLILPLLTNEDPQVRLIAVQALQRLHHPRAVGPLLTRVRQQASSAFTSGDDLTVEEPEPDVRAAAADALGQYAESRVLEVLFIALEDDSLAVSTRALKSLRTLTGQDLPADRNAWVAWLKTASDPFAGRTAYIYPIFERDFRWTDIIPFTTRARNEIPASPIGAPQLRPAG